MSTSRRDFMKLVGISIASLLLTRCRWFRPYATCYTPMPPTPDPQSARDGLRGLWMDLDGLAQQTISGENEENAFGQARMDIHRSHLDTLVAGGEMTAPVADLVQEAYAAAVYHVWRSNAPITCYEPMIVDYAPTGAELLVRQSEVLSELAAQGTVDPETLARARAVFEHDLAYYALSDADEQALYDEILRALNEQGRAVPSFEALELEVSSEAQAAAQFIVDLLANP